MVNPTILDLLELSERLSEEIDFIRIMIDTIDNPLERLQLLGNVQGILSAQSILLDMIKSLLEQTPVSEDPT